MISLRLLLTASWLAQYTTSGFSFQATTSQGGLVNLDEWCERDVYSMVDWATNCGVQKSDGLEVFTQDGQDYEVMTQQDVPVGTPVMYVPSDVMITSYQAAAEFGDCFGQAERMLEPEAISLFRVFYKILVEYEKGADSPWYPWLNATPRLYNTGASMTFACFDCLPPYAAQLAMKERQQFISFQKAIKLVQPSYLSQQTLSDVNKLKWAYNVASTRSIDWNGERMIAPMADMFNHGTETEVDITYDEGGNCMVYASKDIPAGSPLRMSLGDPSNPSILFATYGFLDESSPATFCKTMHLEEEMQELGYTKSDMLFYKDTGDISNQVYDVQLYSILKKNDPLLADEFYNAFMMGDEATKSQLHENYWQYTKQALVNHVDEFLTDLDKLSNKAMTYDPATHPRVPVILQHNGFVKETFMRVKQNLENM